MIPILILTTVAIAVLLIGFFEIRIPFIHKGAAKKTEKVAAHPYKKETNPVKSIRFFFKQVKTGYGYQSITNRKTSGIS